MIESSSATGLVDGYRAQPRPAYDEMLGPDGSVRPGWELLSQAIDQMGPSGLAGTGAIVARMLDGDGVVYRAAGSADAQRWQLDPLPMLIDGAEWAALVPALQQRARLLDALLTDVYGERTVIRDGLVPAEVVLAHQGFLRGADGVRVAGPRQLFSLAADLARDSDGRWVVLHDRAASPSGSGFAMENRRVVSRVLPGMYREAGTTRLAPFFHAMRMGLQEVAPAEAEAPRVVLLTSGAMSETAYDQAFLAQLLGYPLVSGSDLSVRDGRVWLRGLEGDEQVDVILRRLDSDFCDPLDLRPDSQLGVPGLLEACRLGTVSVVNGLGAGVLENPGLMPFLPALCRVLLGEDLLLESARTLWCGDPASLKEVRDRFGSLVLKPISRGASRSGHFGWELSDQARADLLAQIEAEPHLWVGQEAVTASTVPTVGAAFGSVGLTVAPHNMVLRTFAVAQAGDYNVMPGGLVRVAPTQDSLLVSSQVGAVAKDVWVLTSRQAAEADPWSTDAAPRDMRHGVVSPRMAEDLFWLGRYTERAEASTRLLRTVRDRSGDFRHRPGTDGAACLDVLLEVLSAVTGTAPGTQLLDVILDGRRPGTLAHSVQSLTIATHAVRDQLSPDTWLMIGGLETALREAVGGDDLLLEQTLTRVLGNLLALAGLAAESSVRDLGWHFMESGRRLERAQQVTALLRASLADSRPVEVDNLVLESVLVAGESIITFRRRYAPRPEVGLILELLLVDRENPRSVAHALDRLQGNLSHLPSSSWLRAEVERLRELIRVSDVGTLAQPLVNGRRVELSEFLGDLEQQLRAVSRAVESAYFEDVLAPVSFEEVIA